MKLKLGKKRGKRMTLNQLSGICRDHHCWWRWSLALPPAGYGLDPAHPRDTTEGRADGRSYRDPHTRLRANAARRGGSKIEVEDEPK